MLTLDTDQSPRVLRLPSRKFIALPTSADWCYDTCFVQESQELFILTADDLIVVHIPSQTVGIVVSGLRESVNYGRYERIAAIEGMTAMYRYGLGIWKRKMECSFHDDAPYSQLAFLRNGQILAGEPGGSVCTIDPENGSVKAVQFSFGEVQYVGTANDEIIAVFLNDERKVTGIKGMEAWEAMELDGCYFPVCFEPIPDYHLLAIGKCDSAADVAICDLRNWKCVHTRIPDSGYVVQLYWSPQFGELFVGTKYGNVFAVAID